MIDDRRIGCDAEDVAHDVVSQMSDEERLWCLDGDGPFWAGVADLAVGGYHRSPFPAASVGRLGFPGFSFSDGPRGVVVDRATCFPVSMARGATWDVGLEERIGEAIGLELRRSVQICSAVSASTCSGIRRGAARRRPMARTLFTSASSEQH